MPIIDLVPPTPRGPASPTPASPSPVPASPPPPAQPQPQPECPSPPRKPESKRKRDLGTVDPADVICVGDADSKEAVMESLVRAAECAQSAGLEKVVKNIDAVLKDMRKDTRIKRRRVQVRRELKFAESEGAAPPPPSPPSPPPPAARSASCPPGGENAVLIANALAARLTPDGETPMTFCPELAPPLPPSLRGLAML